LGRFDADIENQQLPASYRENKHFLWKINRPDLLTKDTWKIDVHIVTWSIDYKGLS
jgi:hypothetical protein